MCLSLEDKQFIHISNTGYWVTICIIDTNHPMLNVYNSKYVTAHLCAQITINFVHVVVLMTVGFIPLRMQQRWPTEMILQPIIRDLT